MAPNFTLHVTPDQTLTLSDLLRRAVILAFYPADWSPVCGDQMALYNEILPEFRKFGAELLWVSVDGAWCYGASIDEQLAQKGLTKVEKSADVYVGYRATVELEKSMDLWSIGSGGWGDRSVRGQTSTIPVGMLLVDLYDPARKQLIWRGDASKTIDLKKDPDKNYKNPQKAMTKLFKNYPLKAANRAS